MRGSAAVRIGILALLAALGGCQTWQGPGDSLDLAELAGSGRLDLGSGERSRSFAAYWEEVDGQDGLFAAGRRGFASLLCEGRCGGREARQVLAACRKAAGGEAAGGPDDACALLARGRFIVWQGEIVDAPRRHPAFLTHNLYLTQVLAIRLPGDEGLLLGRLMVDPRVPQGSFEAAAELDRPYEDLCSGVFDLSFEPEARGWRVWCPGSGIAAHGTFASFAALAGGPGAGVDSRGRSVTALLLPRGAFLQRVLESLREGAAGGGVTIGVGRREG